MVEIEKIFKENKEKFVEKRIKLVIIIGVFIIIGYKLLIYEIVKLVYNYGVKIFVDLC